MALVSYYSYTEVQLYCHGPVGTTELVHKEVKCSMPFRRGSTVGRIVQYFNLAILGYAIIDIADIFTCQ